jgi:hypothetical protein
LRVKHPGVKEKISSKIARNWQRTERKGGISAAKVAKGQVLYIGVANVLY